MPEVKGTPIGIVGCSMGGRWALWLAANRPSLPIQAVTTLHGARAGDFSKSRAAFQGHLTETDPWVSEMPRHELRRALGTAGRMVDLNIYAGTDHWFFESDRRDACEARAARLARRRTLAFLPANPGS